ncbi:hypothetical protein MKW98_030408 [Papaver atlanticum]|uniref:Uncharacterized protein n=1 Tax=Papaver atlanticum TaxID=357466 RepID=A0AAD4SSE8_9MAGN|nr:hypothetical protein MKW98_030408 [Papaver atlanticum]
MKNLYHKNKDKGKVYPSPSLSSSSSSSSSSTSSSSPSNNNNKDVLNLLPAAILVLVSVLSLEDREVLSYLITMSLKSTNPSSSSSKILVQKFKKTSHKPLFDCGCFDCYTSFWFRWDSSPNRELIHQAIEAFEEHLSKRDDELLLSASSSPSSKHRGKKKDKMGRRNSDKSVDKHQKKKADVITPALPEFEPEKKSLLTITKDIVVLPECVNENEEMKGKQVFEERKAKEEVKEELETVVVVEEAEEQVQVLNNGGHKGLARKVLPDVLGILNSRLWSLWSPNV